MNQNKITLIQKTMDELSSSIDIMISQVRDAKHNNVDGMVYSRLSKYIKSELPVYHERIKGVQNDIIGLNISPDYKTGEIEILNSDKKLSEDNLLPELKENESIVIIGDKEEFLNPISLVEKIQDVTEKEILSNEELNENTSIFEIEHPHNNIESVDILSETENESSDTSDFVSTLPENNEESFIEERNIVNIADQSENEEESVEMTELLSTISESSEEHFTEETNVIHLPDFNDVNNTKDSFDIQSTVNEQVSLDVENNIIDTVSTPVFGSLDDFDLGDDIEVEEEDISEQVNSIPSDKIETEHLEGFLEEWEIFHPQISTYIFELQNGDESSVPSLHRDLHSLKGNAGLVGALRLREKIHAMESVMQAVVEGFKNAKDIANDLYEQFEEVKIMVATIEDGVYENCIFEGKKVIPVNIIEQVINNEESPENYIEGMSVSPSYSDEDEDEDFNEDQWPVFLEEFEELDPKIESLINKMIAGDKTSLVELSRDLHSLKGSIGTTGALKARKAIHEMETILDKVKFEVNELDKDIQLNIAKNISHRFDFFKAMISEISKGNFETYEKLGKDRKDNTLKLTDDSAKEIPQEITKKSKSESVVKVNVDVLNFLFNEVNEVKLGNASNETSILKLNGHLKEFEENVNILSKMLRNLELETESQMQSKDLQIEEAKIAGFESEMDALELDRYKDIHELVHSFSEAVNDTFDIYQALVKVIGEMQAISVTQNRSILETQESLSKARLIPFSSRSDNLQALVKSVAMALGKKAILITENDSIEVDRALLDRLKHALDHTIRNCLTHGIEMPEIRKAIGKREEGTIQIILKQEGGRLYITIEDDGAGINVNKVRSKAIEKGLWDASAPMTDAQAADMISLPSFSTADKIDNYAGRGVGLDVVRNDILSMGGKYEISSVFGKGMKVDIQIPTSISTVFALIVTTGSETLAIPAEVIEEVKFLSKEEVIEAHNKGRITVNIDGSDVEVDFRYLSDLMGIPDDVNEMANYKHLVVCRDRDNIIAVLVNKLMGVKELPIKPLGRTLSSIPGVVSATILPNGVAAFIIDPARARTSLLRYYGIENKESVLPNKNVIDIVNETSNKKLIMVVDDSLTVRKATARFLQKEGYDYILAKDGQNAIEMLATATPDLILLDVEMPRMDGFGLAKHVREHQRHSNVPIIMITSRTAPKHKKRSEALGVNEYMGKPFKEEELLENIKKYTDDK